MYYGEGVKMERKEPTENIIWSWIPTEDQKSICDRNEIISDLAEEYRILKIPDKFPGGIIIWGKYHGDWHANPSGRYVVAELLRELEVIKR